MRKLLTCIGAALVAALVLQGPAEGQRSRPGKPTVARTHLRYTWQERVDALVVSNELNLYGNGFIRYSQRPGLGTPHETTLPNDPGFVAEAERLFQEARGARALHPPCGAPQGGVLVVQLGRRVERFDLERAELWSRYGRLARLLVGRVVGALPQALEADCQPLKLRVDPGQVATAPRAASPLGTRDEEPGLLLAFGGAQSDEAKREHLARLAGLRDGDRFFRLALLRQHAESLPARRLLRQHASALVRGVRSEPEARELMSLLEGVAGAEALHHRAVLAQLLSLHEEAARLQLGFRRSLNQLGSSEREAAALRALGAAEVDSRRVQPPWGPIRSAFPRLFLGWLDLAQKVWAGEAAQAPPLAILLYRRALHFAVRSVLVPSLRAGRGSAEAGARARSLLLKYFLPLSRGRWDALPHWARQDLLEVTGLLRRSQQGLDKAWIASALEAPTETVCRMIRMSYFDVADRFIQRSIEQRTSSEGALRLSQGRCLREREHFSEARRAFDQAVAADVKGAREARVQALLDQGDLEAAERELEAVIPKTAAAWRAQSRLYRLLGQGDDAYEAARRALRAEPGEPSPQTLVAIGRGAALAGRFAEARASFRQAAGGQGEVAYEARERWARLESSMGRPRAALDAAWPLTMEPDPIARVAGSAMIAVAAARLAMPALVQLQIQRALYHADGDPRALLRLALILSEGGRGQLAALGALRDAIGLRPGWSVLYAQQAMILGQLRRLPEALEAIRVALRIRGAFPPYRALEAALLKLAASSRGEILDQTPKWAGKDDAESGPDGGSPAPAGPASPVTPPARHATVADSMGMSATSGADGGVRQVPPDPGPHRGGRTP